MPAIKRHELRERRQKLGVKLGPFSDLAGIKYQSYANIEAGCHNPSIEYVHRIAKVLTELEGKPCKAEELLEPVAAKAAA